jgi:tetratricopeptide (TPR) repeat protein
MPRHPIIICANEVRNYDPLRAAEMVEELILKGDSTAPAGGAYDLLGQIYLKAGDLLSARDSFLKNLEIYPDSDGTFCYIGLIEQILGNSSKAQEWYSVTTV